MGRVRTADDRGHPSSREHPGNFPRFPIAPGTRTRNGGPAASEVNCLPSPTARASLPSSQEVPMHPRFVSGIECVRFADADAASCSTCNSGRGADGLFRPAKGPAVCPTCFDAMHAAHADGELYHIAWLPEIDQSHIPALVAASSRGSTACWPTMPTRWRWGNPCMGNSWNGPHANSSSSRAPPEGGGSGPRFTVSVRASGVFRPWKGAHPQACCHGGARKRAQERLDGGKRTRIRRRVPPPGRRAAYTDPSSVRARYCFFDQLKMRVGSAPKA